MDTPLIVMLIPRGIKANASDEIHNRILRIEDQQRQSGELLVILDRYANTLTELNNIEQQLASRLKLWYTDYSVYSPLIQKLKEAIDYRATSVTEDTMRLRTAIRNQMHVEDESYKTLKATINNYFNSERMLHHYDDKLPRLNPQRSMPNSDSKVSSKKLERVLRNERKLDNARTDTQTFSSQIINETTRLNLERFDRINPLIKMFISLQLRESLMNQEKFLELENYEQVLDDRESDFFNQRYFEPIAGSSIRYVNNGEGVSNIMPNNTALLNLSQRLSARNSVDKNYDANRDSRLDMQVVKQEVRSFDNGKGLEISRVSEKESQRIVNAM